MKGSSLIELMIALCIGSVVMISCFQVFFSIKKISNTQNALAVIQENARTIDAILGEAVRGNGKIGCNGLKEDVSLKNHTTLDLQYYGFSPQDNPLGISEKNLKINPYVAPTVLQRMVPGNPILWLKGISKSYILAKIPEEKIQHLSVHTNPSLKKHLKSKKLIILSDCESMDVFEVASVERQSKGIDSITLNISKETQLSKHYAIGSEVGILSSRIFYIGNTYRTHINGQPVLALYMTDLNGRTLELVENVEALEVTYDVKHLRAVMILSGNNKTVTKKWTFEWPIQSN
jgi:hypothetical protein